MTPSSTPGATTVIAGNCGVGFAPVRPGDHDTLIPLIEGVEDIPRARRCTRACRGNGYSFAEYMDAVDRLPHDIDVAVQVATRRRCGSMSWALTRSQPRACEPPRRTRACER